MSKTYYLKDNLLGGSGVKFGLGKIHIQDQETKEWKTLGAGITEATLTYNEENETPVDDFRQFEMEGSMEGSLEITIGGKRHGNFMEKYLYYKFNRKKRIRKKYMKKYWSIFGIEVTKDWYLHRK